MSAAVSLAAISADAANLPHEILPSDTIAVFTVPDVKAAGTLFNDSPFGKLLEDDAMQPFLDHAWTQLQENILKPIQEESGFDLAQIVGLVEGQATLAVTKGGWDGSPGGMPGFFILCDSGSQKAKVTELLGKMKTELASSGETTRPAMIRNAEFTAIDADEFEIFIGQADSLLIAGNSQEEIEKLLVRKDGGSLPALDENDLFAANRAAHFRNAYVYGWLNFDPIRENVLKLLQAQATPDNPVNPVNVFNALGFGGLDSLGFGSAVEANGGVASWFLQVPEGKRKGLFNLLNFRPESAAPLPFVSETVASYSRIRLDGQKAWASLEAMLTEASPQMSMFLLAMVSNLGKDFDPNFDLKANVIGNLGDDILVLTKDPTGASIEDISAAPQLFLIGSPNAPKLLEGLRTLSRYLTQGGGPQLIEREVAGTKIYSLAIAQEVGISLELSAANGYVALATSAAFIEEFVRGNAPDRPLRAKRGLNQAADLVGGMGSGLFGVTNDKGTMEYYAKLLKENPTMLEDAFASLPGGGEDNPVISVLKSFDFSLLPDPAVIGRYFSFTVFTGEWDEKGLTAKAYVPNPEGI